MPWLALGAIVTTLSLRIISGISRMNSSPTSANSPMKVSMPYLPTYTPSSPSSSSQHLNTGDDKAHGPATCSVIP